jgi:hypothetical protein
MLDVDYVLAWRLGRREFSTWLLSSGLLANFVYVRSMTPFSFLKSAFANVAMTTLSWLLTVASLFAWTIVNVTLFLVTGREIFHGSTLPFSWILVLLTSGVIIAASQSAVLYYFKYRVTKPGFGLLVLVNLFCVVLASYRTWIYLIAHPPEA